MLGQITSYGLIRLAKIAMDRNLIAKGTEGRRAVLHAVKKVSLKEYASIRTDLELFLLAKETCHYVQVLQKESSSAEKIF